MGLRVTQNSINRTQMAGLDQSLSRLQDTQRQLNSGKRLTKPSDSPVDTVAAMRLRDQQRQLSQLGDNITDGLSRLQASDDALTRMGDMLGRIRTLVVRGASGTYSGSDRAAMSAEIAQLKSGLVQLANTQIAGQPVFAGTANVTNAFDPVTGAYQGNSEDVLRKVTSTEGAAGEMNVAIPGDKVFGSETTGINLLGPDTGTPATTGLLEKIIANFTAGDLTALNGNLADLDAAHDQVLSAQSTVGARVNRLQSLQELNGQQDDAAVASLSKVEDTDFMKAAMDLAIQENAYKAALQSSAKVIQPSLMDFIR